MSIKYKSKFNFLNLINKKTLILEAKSLDQIAIAERPLKLGGILKDYSKEEFQAKFGKAWQEGIVSKTPYYNYPKAKTNIVSSVTSDELSAQVSFILKKPETRLAICKVDDRVGYGVFAKEAIPKDTVIAIYSGEIAFYGGGNYAFQYFQTDYLIQPTDFRGIASFFQHLPSNTKFTSQEFIKIYHETLKQYGDHVTIEQVRQTEELSCFQFESEEVKKQIATANLTTEYLVYNGIPIIVFLTNRDIELGEILGFNYGYEYWLAQNQFPCYFDRNGAVISQALYKRTYGTINLNGFWYTGEFSPLISKLKEDRIIYQELNQPGYSKVDLEIALFKANAIGSDEMSYSTFTQDKGKLISLAESQEKTSEFLGVLEQTAINFNRSHCQMRDKYKGYWKYHQLKQQGIDSVELYEKGFLNSPLFVKTATFCFESREGVTAWEACDSLLDEAAFGVINDTLWSEMCYLFALRNYLGQDWFNILFPKISLSNSFRDFKLFTFYNQFGSNYGGLTDHKNTPDYSFRHPFSDYQSLSGLKLPRGLLCFGLDNLLSKQEITEFLQQKYYEEQTAEELDYIQKVSAQHLLEYATPNNKFKTQELEKSSANIAFFTFIKEIENHYDLHNWIKWYNMKYTPFSLVELDIFQMPSKKNKITVDAFSYSFWWRFEFQNQSLKLDECYVYPLSEKKPFQLFFQETIHTRAKYSYADRLPMIMSEEMIMVCSSVVAFFRNANHFTEHKVVFHDAFELMQKLRFQLLQMQIEGTLQSKQEANFEKPQLQALILKPNSDDSPKKDAALTKNNTLTKKEAERISLFIEQTKSKEVLKDLCYQIGLPQDASKQEIVKKRKDLLIFWHPDRNKSIIAVPMCQKISLNGDAAIKLCERLEQIEQILKLDQEATDINVPNNTLAF